jgi:arsenical pump membrane protein
MVAAPLAAVLVLSGALPWPQTRETLRELLPTVLFLALILLFAHLCAAEGVFRYLAGLARRGSRGSPRRLLALVVLVAAAVTTGLTLDSTVVLLTPVIAAAVLSMGIDGRAHVYACLRLANSGSLLLPVSNLTNLLAFAATGLSFGRFAAVMAIPFAAAVACEWLALRLWFAHRLPSTAVLEDRAPRRLGGPPDEPAPGLALAVAAAALAGFGILSAVGASPAWAALGASAVLGVPRLLRGVESPSALVREMHPGFCVFVLSLGVIVAALSRHGLSDLVARLLPDRTGLLALLGVALVAAVLSNLVNNIPATLMLTPLLAGRPDLLLAMLVGVNVGPNATYLGSLANLLWVRRLPAALRPRARDFHAFGLATTPFVLLATVVALWLSWQAVGA